MSRRVNEPRFYTRLGYIIFLAIALLAIALAGLPRLVDRMRDTNVVVVDTVKVVNYPQHKRKAGSDSIASNRRKRVGRKSRRKPDRSAPVSPPRNPLNERAD